MITFIGLIWQKNINMVSLVLITEVFWVLFYFKLVLTSSYLNLVTPLIISLFILSIGGFEFALFLILYKFILKTKFNNKTFDKNESSLNNKKKFLDMKSFF